MRGSRPSSRRREAILWALLLGIASSTLFAERPFTAWRYDLGLEDVARRKLAAYALREVPDGELIESLQALFARGSQNDPELASIAGETVRHLSTRAGAWIAQSAAASGRTFVEEAELVLGPAGPGQVDALIEALLAAPEPELRQAGLELRERR